MNLDEKTIPCFVQTLKFSISTHYEGWLQTTVRVATPVTLSPMEIFRCFHIS